MHSRTRAALLPLLFVLTAASPAELKQWQKQADRVSITRDDWGIAHVKGKSDADAVFGMIYAQAEDDFPRIEANYLTNLGRTAEAEGEKAIWQDLRARLYVSESELQANYKASPDWLKKLMDGWAAGVNYYLATHPQVHPRVLTRFEPWMALSFTEGSIGGDIERIDLGELQKFYNGKQTLAFEPRDPERNGSNGIAIAPKITRDGNALLLINPHTSFFFRSEQQVTSDEGLNAYGAATWGQFFIYQGFNQHAGWMHTSSGVDSVDEFAEKLERKGKGFCYRYGKECRPLATRPVTVRYRTADGQIASREFKTWRTHHGPIVRGTNGRWVAFAMMDRPVTALQQSFLRTKTRDLADFLKVANLKSNSSNDTIFADDKGEIAYLHPQFVPRRDDRFDYTKPVDGSDPATDRGPLHTLAELPSVTTPPNGWVQNTNTWPYRAAGPNSADPKRFPKYMDMDGENYRGVHALQLLTNSSGWTLEKLQAAAYDSLQPAFVDLIPQLVKAFDALPKKDPRRERLDGAINILRTWDYRWSAGSVAQSLAVNWGLTLRKALNAPTDEPGNKVMMRLGRDTTAEQKLKALDTTVAALRRDFGWSQVPWGEINRFQRISPAIKATYSDAAPSIPVPFADGNFGSLASFRSMPRDGTKKWYGDYGNSFVAVVEFGNRVRARAVTAGGESGNPTSPHFNDEAERYATGNLRDVYFYPDQLKGHTERRYKPGQ
ncbi:penicillin acylase family protein [Sphingomonas sp. SM33]|uniref:Penicillin acylase family protein n=1 Tax=Sphingomonas telluris TaxID=2907998 RepID=A0ABS9VMR2_9SPHN|nr:penicillin acylase family protein [Sphingomonas telluris]MCH8616276.1 penicillin acylase family protein [Sphingomonas telluris]